MNKFKNILRDKILDLKRFAADHLKVSVFFAVMLFSFSIYFIVFADDAAKYSVDTNNTTISLATGSDVSNGKLPNFGTIKYDINVDYKLDSGTPNNNDKIPTYVDIYIPNSFTADIENSTAQSTSPLSGYKHYFISSSNGDYEVGDSIQVTMKNINNRGSESTFSPVISVRTETTPSTTNMLPNDLKNITITSTLNYKVKVFSGNPVKSGNKVIVPVGVMLYLPYDNTNGIKGLQNVSSASYSLNVSGASFSLKSSNYKYEAGSTYNVNGLPLSNSSGISVSGNTVNITGIDINPSNKYGTQSSDFGVNANSVILSSNMFLYECTVSSNINYTISATISNPSSTNSITGQLYKNTSIGEFEPKVTFQDPRGTINQNLAEAVYGQNINFFVSDNYVTGSNSAGDTLSNIITNIKLDPNITEVEVSKIYVNDEDKTNEYMHGISYYKLPWASTSFSTTAACSINPSSLNSDQLMNLFGGPCLSATSPASVQAKTYGITYIKFDSGSVSNFSLAPGSKLVFQINAKINDLYTLLGQKPQIVTNSTTKASFDNVTQSIYYLGKTVNASDTATASNPNNYAKTNTTGTIGNVVSVVAGFTTSIDANTYLSSKYTEDETYTELNSQNDFYSGRDEPIIWNFHPITHIGSETDITEIQATITIPKVNNNSYLEFLDIFLTKNSNSIWSATSKKYEELVCTTSGSNGCKYTKTDVAGGTNYTVTITNTSQFDKNVESFLNNGIFVKTNIDLIASTGDVQMPFSLKYKFSTFSESGAINTESPEKSVVGQTKIHVVRSSIANNGSLSFENGELKDSLQADPNTKYNYYMNSIIGAISSKYEIINVLPYNTETENNFHGTYSINLNSLPAGYSAYYLSKANTTSTNIETIKDNSNWTPWASGTVLNNTEVVAIKVKFDNPNSITTNNIPIYFGGTKNSISISILPNGNEYGDRYSNTFYTYTGNKLYDTKPSIFSIFNRSIEGLVFEDYDYDGLYSLGENVVKDLTVELYRVENYNPTIATNVSEYESLGTKVGEAIYTTDKGYKFEKLNGGHYYVKIIFNSEKYNITDFEKDDSSMGDSYDSNSKFKLGSDVNIAVSKIVLLDSNSNINLTNINLGLKIKQSFAVSVEKYIKNIKIVKGIGTESRDYDHAKDIKLDFRDLNGTSFEVTYGFDIKNTRYYPGYIGAIVEAIPNEMNFDASLPENVGWQEEGGLLYYNGLSETLIMPDETYSFEIKLTIPSGLAGDFINIISVGDLRMLESEESNADNQLENVISTLGIEKGKK